MKYNKKGKIKMAISINLADILVYNSIFDERKESQ